MSENKEAVQLNHNLVHRQTVAVNGIGTGLVRSVELGAHFLQRGGDGVEAVLYTGQRGPSLLQGGGYGP